MTAYQLLAPMPELTLDAGCTVTWEAIDPATGAAVTGVAITAASVRAVNYAPNLDTTPPNVDDVLPFFVPIPEDEAA